MAIRQLNDPFSLRYRLAHAEYRLYAPVCRPGHHLVQVVGKLRRAQVGVGVNERQIA